MRILATATEEITSIFNSMELSQLFFPTPSASGASGSGQNASFGPGVVSRGASFSAAEQASVLEQPEPMSSDSFGVPNDILNSDALLRLSAASPAPPARPSAASAPRVPTASNPSAPPTPSQAGPGSGGDAWLAAPMPDFQPLTTAEMGAFLVSRAEVSSGAAATCSCGGAAASGSGGGVQPTPEPTPDEMDRRAWHALIATMAALTANLAMEGRTIREKRAAVLVFYQGVVPRLSTLGPVGHLAQQRLAVMVAEVGLAPTMHGPAAAAAAAAVAAAGAWAGNGAAGGDAGGDAAMELASGLSSGGLSGRNALVGLPNDEEFLEIVAQGLAAVKRYASSAMVTPVGERRGVAPTPILAPPGHWFGGGFGGVPGMLVASPGDPLSTEVRPKLHACKNCQRAKTACMDARPCARCIRLGLNCDGDGKAVRRACASCKRAKVRCNLGDGLPCARCIRLNLECAEHAKNKKSRGGAGEEEGVGGRSSLSSPVHAPAAGQYSGHRGSGEGDVYALPPLMTATPHGWGGGMVPSPHLATPVDASPAAESFVYGELVDLLGSVLPNRDGMGGGGQNGGQSGGGYR